MNAHGRDCTITVKTGDTELTLPYAEETIRDDITVLNENAPIEGGGVCSGIAKTFGVAGCVVTPLTLSTAPLLLALAAGKAAAPLYVTQTYNVYRHTLELVSFRGSPHFDLVQGRGNERKIFEQCRVRGFELRIERDEILKLKLDITSELSAADYPYAELPATKGGERFRERGVSYSIDNEAVSGIYGVTISVTKSGGAKTEVRIHRVLDSEHELPPVIGNFVITAKLHKDSYELNRFGTFRISLSNLLLMADETSVDSGGAVIGPLRYYCAGNISADVFTATSEALV